MKWTLLLPALAVALVAIIYETSPVVEATVGISLVDAAGTVLAATNPAQTTALAIGAAAITALGLGVGFLLPSLFGGDDGGDEGDVVVDSYSHGGGYGAPSAGYGAPSAGYGAPATGYGAPSSGYGAPSTGYGGSSGGHGGGHGGGGASSYAAPAQSYGAPSNSYGAPAAPAYGAPSSGYGRRRGVAATTASTAEDGKKRAKNDDTVAEAIFKKFFRRNKRSVSKTEISLIAQKSQEMFNIMAQTDPADCYRRLICDLATGDARDFGTAPILNLLEDSIEDEVKRFMTPNARNFRYELKMAKRLGQKTGSVRYCEDVFKCPISGRQMDKLVSEVRRQQELDGTLPAKVVV